jgi:ketosteroid isomerase-like protein
MSDENVEVVRGLYERVIASGKMEDPATAELIPEFFDPEIQIRQMSGFVDTAGDFEGYQGIADSTRELVRSFADLGFVPEEIGASRDQVAAVALASGSGRRSGARFEKRVGHLFTLRDCRVVRWEVFADPADAFRAAGLSA